MAKRQFKELLGLAMIGEGIVGLLYPRKYSLLWKIGPEPVKDTMQKAAENPALMRAIYAAEAGIGLWLATQEVEKSANH